MLCLGRSRGPNPWGLRPLWFWPWDLPRHNIHHDTSSAFSNNVPLQWSVYSVQCTVYSVQCTVYSVQCTVYLENLGRVQLKEPPCSSDHLVITNKQESTLFNQTVVSKQHISEDGRTKS